MNKRKNFNIKFLQPSHNIAGSTSGRIREYYRRVYEFCPGYTMPEHFMELPLWVAILSGKLSEYKQELYVLTSQELPMQGYPRNMNDVYLASAMDANKRTLWFAAKARPQNIFLIGGYINPNYFSDLPNVVWCDTPDDAVKFLTRATNDEPPSFHLFEGYKTIPRITLSRGCMHNCNFCTIPRKLDLLGRDEILDQVFALWGLDFELVYIDDKTFGQADNWTMIKEIGDFIRDFNSDFLGFIVQTTVPVANVLWERFFECGVKYVEVGVEIPDDEFLRQMRKPYRTAMLEGLMRKLEAWYSWMDEPGFIPNLIFGVEGDNYHATLEWVRNNSGLISFVNPFILSIYEDAKGTMISNPEARDSDETSSQRSWLSRDDHERMLDALDQVLRMTSR